MQRVRAELRFALSYVPAERAPRRVPVGAADVLPCGHHGGGAGGAAGGGRLYEAAGSGPLLFRQPHPGGGRQGAGAV